MVAVSFRDFVRAGQVEWIGEAEGFWKGSCWHGQHACDEGKCEQKRFHGA